MMLFHKLPTTCLRQLTANASLKFPPGSVPRRLHQYICRFPGDLARNPKKTEEPASQQRQAVNPHSGHASWSTLMGLSLSFDLLPSPPR